MYHHHHHYHHHNADYAEGVSCLLIQREFFPIWKYSLRSGDIVDGGGGCCGVMMVVMVIYDDDDVPDL